ncbi:MAG: preprotein translocase subunit SecY [Candidatus Fermentithermobacillus carboniphilus]|uniref:Protein translocase subunit SecY n=1 Tax=Candidatus Fermentithermobacillus carboniphilus TaxID=3085328 RepID=A0AAT9L9G5_9FIRM|nr:MAG: preprotein translocase subunit SecY [Candidatus Fermentithermobacillus carboniphilus]
MFGTLRNAWRIPDLRRRILFTIAMLVVFRAGVAVPVPGIIRDVIAGLFSEGTLFTFMDLFSGGALSSYSVFAMSIYPYINSSIIVQLLTMVIPKWEEMSKEEEGRKKLQEYTRYGTIILGLLQATGMTLAIRAQGALVSNSIWVLIEAVLSLTAGTAFLMWLGELITEKGIGNGISLFIFAGIISGMPRELLRIYALLKSNQTRWYNVLGLAAVSLVTLVLVIWITEGERRIPVQYSRRVVGRKMMGGYSTHIPIRINQAGVIPVIFASSLLAFPATIASFVHAPWAQKIGAIFDYQQPWYTALYALLIFGFTFFYTAMIFNPLDVADNMRKYGGFIPGIRPGKPTADALSRVVTRITAVGAVFLAVIAVLPNFMIQITGLPGFHALGGTALLIVIGVALETMKQIEAELVMRNYQGFLK